MKRGAPSHPKLESLGEALGLRKREVVGLVELLHHFTDTYAVRGDIGRFSNQQIARRVDWEDDPDQLIDALIAVGLVDIHPVHRLVVHDWKDHAPEYTKRKVGKGANSADPLGWAVDDVPPDPPSGSSRINPDESGLPRQGKASQGKAGGGKTPAATAAPRRRSRPRKKPETPPPDRLDPEAMAKLRDWLEGNSWWWFEPRLELSVARCLEHWRGKGETRVDWVASCRTWIGRDVERLLEPRHDEEREALREQAERRLDARDRAKSPPEPSPQLTGTDPELLAQLDFKVIDGGAPR